MIWIQFLVVLICIYIGARMGGIGLGVMGGVGVAVLVFLFKIDPGPVTAPVNAPFALIPIDVMLIILAVITAAATLQASGGLDYLVYVAEKILRKNPKAITFVAPLVTYLFTFLAGTGHVAYALLPVIAEVSREAGVRPERPLSIGVIASQQAITASPISAATAAMLAIFTDIKLSHILMICIPATLLGVVVASFVVSRMGKELPNDPEYQKRLKAGLDALNIEKKTFTPGKGARLSVALFIFGALLIVIFGSFPELRPAFPGVDTSAGIENAVEIAAAPISMATTIMIVMLTISVFMITLCKTNVEKIASTEVFRAGTVAVTAIFGIAWMGNVFFSGNKDTIVNGLSGIVTDHPWLFAVALFILSILVFSQAAATRILMPIGLSLGLSPALLVGMFPAVNGYFFFPNYPTMVAAINFDRTGTTRVGKYMLNHSFMLPGMIATIVAVVTGIGIGIIIL